MVDKYETALKKVRAKRDITSDDCMFLGSLALECGSFDNALKHYEQAVLERVEDKDVFMQELKALEEEAEKKPKLKEKFKKVMEKLKKKLER